MKEDPLVSIIIPSYKSANNLRYVLESIKNQTYKNIEVIVVDRPSEDGTKELVNSFGYIYISYESERTKAANYGVKNSSGDYIYYTGSDYVLEKDLVDEIVKTVLKDDTDAAIIINVIKPLGFWSKVKQLEKETYIGDDLIEAARFISKKAFDDIGGYDETMVAYEEHDLHNRLIKKCYKISRVKNVKEINIGEPNSIFIYAKKHFYYGKTIGIYFKKYPKKAMAQWSPIRHSYIRHWKKFFRHPMLTIGFIIYQLVRYSSTGLGYISIKVYKK